MPSPLNRYLETGGLLAGRFRLTGLVGEGAYSTVYGGVDEETGQRVAVKALPSKESGASKRDHLRLERELKVGRSLSSPYVAGIFDWRIAPDDVSYIVMEYVEGETLAEVIDREAPFEPNVALEVMRQLALGLAEAHDSGVVHRDLKPDNVMVVGETGAPECIKIVDFGLAKLHARLCDTSIVEVTRQGRAVGTPRYIAPEQAKGKDVGPWSDLYALGLLFYEMLTAEQVVKPDDVEGALKVHVNPEPLPMPKIDELPRGCGQLIRRLTAHDARNRYRDAGHLAEDIDAYLRERRGDDMPEEHRRPPGRKVTRWSWMRPMGAMQWTESVMAACVTLASFIAVTAHFPQTPYAVRLAIGLLPVLLAVSGALAASDRRWRAAPIRRTNLYGLVAFVGAHVFQDREWLLELKASADWFLEPIDHLPVAAQLADLIRSSAAWWARLWM